MDGAGGCHDTLKASEGEIKKMKHGSTQAFDPWNKKDTRNAFHSKRNLDISTVCDVIFRRIPPIKKCSLLRTDSVLYVLTVLDVTYHYSGFTRNGFQYTRVCVYIYIYTTKTGEH